MSALGAFLTSGAIFGEGAIDELAEDLTDCLATTLCQLKERGRPICGQEQPDFNKLGRRSSMRDGRLRAV
jgi:hypothetical protein